MSRSDLRAELVGRYALAKGELVSECTDHFTDMNVVGGRLTGGTGVRFARGELLRIDNVSVGAMAGLDVNLTLVEPFLLSFEDGPFQVYDERRCRVQLNFEVGRDVRKDAAEVAGRGHRRARSLRRRRRGEAGRLEQAQGRALPAGLGEDEARVRRPGSSPR